MKSLKNRTKDLIIVFTWLNVIYLLVTFFYMSKVLTIVVVLLNIILGFTYLIMDKYGNMFDAISQSNKILKSLNSSLGT